MAPPPPQPSQVTQAIAAWGCIAGGAFVTALFVYKTFLGAKTPPLPLAITLMIVGVLDIVLGVGLLKKNRVAWAFALALHIVASIVCLLAVPAIARTGLPKPVAMVPVLLIIGMIVVIALSSPVDPPPPIRRRPG